MPPYFLLFIVFVFFSFLRFLFFAPFFSLCRPFALCPPNPNPGPRTQEAGYSTEEQDPRPGARPGPTPVANRLFMLFHEPAQQLGQSLPDAQNPVDHQTRVVVQHHAHWECVDEPPIRHPRPPDPDKDRGHGHHKARTRRNTTTPRTRTWGQGQHQDQGKDQGQGRRQNQYQDHRQDSGPRAQEAGHSTEEQDPRPGARPGPAPRARPKNIIRT